MQLDLISVMVLAIGLAMDAFAVSIALGASLRKLRATQVLRLALAFGIFQGLMPVIGYLAGLSLAQNPWVAAFDHWIAFGLLGFLGGKMIYEAKFLPDEPEESADAADPTKSVTLLLLALATSIDALAVGASLAFLRVRILLPALITGLVTGLFAIIGARLGQQAGRHWGKRVEIAGGLALIAIGVRILIEHLLMPAPALQGAWLSFV